MSKPNTPAYEKVIRYDPACRDFLMLLDDEPVGYARTYIEAERTLDELVYSLLSRSYVEIPAEEIAA
jgi:hypothetical protein